MNLMKTTLLSGLATSIAMCSNFVLIKIFAVFVGPAGLAIVGQLGNFIQIMQTVSGNVYQQGLIKYTAEHRQDKHFLRELYQTATTLMLYATIVFSSFLLFYSEKISVWILHSPQYSGVIRFFALTLFLFVLNNFFLSILNGMKEVRKYIAAKIFGSIFSLSISVALVLMFNLYGALYAMTLVGSGMAVFTAYLVARCAKFDVSYFMPRISKDKLLRLLKFAAMSIVAGLALPVSQLVVRSYIMHTLGHTNAGYWQGMTRISSALVSVITTALSIYYIPTLAALNDKKLIFKEITACYKIFMPILLLVLSIAWIFRTEVIHLLFTDKFLPMRPLFFYQFLGIFFQVASWVICNLMWAKGMARIFIASEIVFVLSYIFLTTHFTLYFGLLGSVLGFCTNYILYFVFAVILLFFYVREAV